MVIIKPNIFLTILIINLLFHQLLLFIKEY